MGCIKSRQSTKQTSAVKHLNIKYFDEILVVDSNPVKPKEKLFDKDLLEVFRENHLTDEDVIRAQTIRDELTRELDKRKPAVTESDGNEADGDDIKVEIIGSYLNKIGDHNTDIDMTLLPSSEESSDNLENISTYLKEQSDNGKSNFEFLALETSPFQFIKLKHIPTESVVNISWNRREDVLMAFLLDMYTNINPLLCPLIVLLKVWSRKHNFLNAAGGYIGGFQLALMAVYHQQERNAMPQISVQQSMTKESMRESVSVIEKMDVPEKLKESALVVQLRDFFNFYFDVFDYFSVVDIREGYECSNKLTFSDDNAEWWSPLAMVHPIFGEKGGNCAVCLEHEQMHELRQSFEYAASLLN